MIGYTHIEVLREQLAESERRVAGWKYLLAHAEQVENAGSVLPDALSAPWPAPPAPNDYGAALRAASCSCGLPGTPGMVHTLSGCQPAASSSESLGRPPYPPAATPAFDGTLPPEKQQALDTFASEHHDQALTSKAVKEDQKWRKA